MTTTTPPQAIECRFAIYSKSSQDSSDIHLVKEQVHQADGTIVPNVKILLNEKRPFWVTKPGARNHEDRKEWEAVTNLTKFEATQTDLTNAVARAFGRAGYRGTLRDFPESRYLFGSDILSTAIIKQRYIDRWNVISPFTYAVFDTETDMVHGTGQIMMATLSFKTKVFTVVRRSFVQRFPDAVERIHAAAKKYLGEIIAARKITIEVILVDSELDVIKEVLCRAHEWKPDLIGVWNIEFDMTKIIEACDRAGVRPEDFLCDPKVPQRYRSFRFKKGAAKKVSSSGVVQSFTPAQRWHTVFCPSSFYWIDAMCSYRAVRTGQPEEPSYKLNDILNKDLKISKLKFKEADHLKDGSPEHHTFMQTHYPIEYVVYNMFDCISMEMLEEENNDVTLSLPMFSGCSDFQNFNSQPRRSVNALHYFVQKHGHVIGSTASEMTDDNDADTLTIKDWIVMLDAHLVADNGLMIIDEAPALRTNIRVDVADLDVSASYPTGERVFNISKETTSKELISIDGIPEDIQRMQTINLSAGRVNATEFACAMMGLPTKDEMLASFQKSLAAQASVASI